MRLNSTRTLESNRESHDSDLPKTSSATWYSFTGSVLPARKRLTDHCSSSQRRREFRNWGLTRILATCASMQARSGPVLGDECGAENGAAILGRFYHPAGFASCA